MKGAFIAARAVFSCFFFEITTCKLKNNVLCLITLDLQMSKIQNDHGPLTPNLWCHHGIAENSVMGSQK